MDVLACAKQVFETELRSLTEAANSIDDTFIRLVDDIRTCKGRVIITGMGKSSHVGAKIAATMSSLGTPTFFLHPAESLHGDLGRVTKDDLVLIFSKSGESEEINRMMPSIKKIGAIAVAVTFRDSSTLSQNCHYHIKLSIIEEASAYNLAPTSSTTVMMVFGDALAVCLEKLSGFTPDDYAVYHPSGALGKRLLLAVSDIMVKYENVPWVLESASIKDAIIEMSNKTIVGGVAIVDKKINLLGIFTDGDLRRLLRSGNDAAILERAISDVMTKEPVYLKQNVKAVDALALALTLGRSIGILPVVDNDKKLTGMITVHDLINSGI